MARFDVKLDYNIDAILNGRKLVNAALVQAMQDVVDDLKRTSSETAPHDKGILEKSVSGEVTVKGNSVEGTVSFSAKEGDFDYAIWTHEMTYELGPGSLSKSGGTGMSGTQYPVGNKYLTRPLEGEAATYRDHIANEVNKALGGGK